MAQQESSSSLPKPLRPAAAVLRKVPGAGLVARAAEDTLDRIGAVSPRGRRMLVYAGAGVLGAAGIVEWPVALTGAAVVWLTQSRPGDRDAQGGGGRSGDAAGQEPVGELEAPGGGKAAGGREASEKTSGRTSEKASEKASGKASGKGKKASGGAKATAGRKASAGKASSGSGAEVVFTGRPRVTARLHSDD